ncbi:hypothetical protein ACLBXX_18635 [Microbacterium sp. C23T]
MSTSEHRADVGAPTRRWNAPAAVSLGLSVLGFIGIVALLFPLGSRQVVNFLLAIWEPAARIAFVSGLFAAAFVLVVVAWFRPAARMRIPATIVVFVGVGGLLLTLYGTSVLRGLDSVTQPYDVYLSGEEHISSTEHPLAYGTEVRLTSIGTHEPAIEVMASQPIDVTARARDAGLPVPINGAYIAVPVAVHALDEAGFTDENGVHVLPEGQWTAGARARSDPVQLSLEGFPTRVQLRESGDPHGRFYDFFDVPADDPTGGVYSWRLEWVLNSDRQNAFWGDPIDNLHAHDFSGRGASVLDPLPFGTPLTLQSAATLRDAAIVEVLAPIDVTDAAAEASAPAPVTGGYVACPIEVTLVDPQAMAVPASDMPLPPGLYIASDQEGSQIAAEVAIPGFPGQEQSAALEPGVTTTYFQVFDASPETLTAGRCMLALSPPGDDAQYATWGPAPR